MDELNNKQMILLTMFTSFVVAIATGIITVAMLQEAPPLLTQTVNRVVERTIERVVTGSSTPERPTPAPIITNVTKEVTVYAKEDDLVVAAVEKNQPRVARVHAVDAATSSDPLAIGFVISRDGLIVSETKSLFDDEPAKESYHVIIGEKRYVATLIAHQNEAENPVSFLKISDLVQGESLDAVSFGRAGEQKLAQTVVVLGGISGDGVFKTTLSKLRYIKSDATGTPQVLSGIETLPRIPDENLGGLVVNLDGQAVGMVISGSESVKYVIYPVARLLEQVGASQTASSEKTHDQSAIVSESSVF
jgi:S1-C subfamily serine protease